MKNLKILLLLTILIKTITALNSEENKPYKVETYDKDISCSIKELSIKEAEDSCNYWIEQEAKKALISYVPKFKIPKGYTPFVFNIKNDSSNYITIDIERCLGVNIEKAHSAYTGRPWLQYATSLIPAILGGLLTTSAIYMLENDRIYTLLCMPFLIVGTAMSTSQFEDLKKSYNVLKDYSPICFNGTYIIKPKSNFSDIILIKKESAANLTDSSLRYIRHRLKRWNPQEMTTIPNDGYVYYLDEDNADLSNIKSDDIIVDGILTIKPGIENLTLIIHPKRIMRIRGIFLIPGSQNLETYGKITYESAPELEDAIFVYHHKINSGQLNIPMD